VLSLEAYIRLGGGGVTYTIYIYMFVCIYRKDGKIFYLPEGSQAVPTHLSGKGKGSMEARQITGR